MGYFNLKRFSLWKLFLLIFCLSNFVFITLHRSGKQQRQTISCKRKPTFFDPKREESNSLLFNPWLLSRQKFSCRHTYGSVLQEKRSHQSNLINLFKIDLRRMFKDTVRNTQGGVSSTLRNLETQFSTSRDSVFGEWGRQGWAWWPRSYLFFSHLEVTGTPKSIKISIFLTCFPK